MLKRCSVFLLPTNEKANIYEDLIAGNDWIPQHLYILSDDEIKKR